MGLLLDVTVFNCEGTKMPGKPQKLQIMLYLQKRFSILTKGAGPLILQVGSELRNTLGCKHSLLFTEKEDPEAGGRNIRPSQDPG